MCDCYEYINTPYDILCNLIAFQLPKKSAVNIVAWRLGGRGIERPLLINGYAYLAVSLPDNGPVDSNS
jgi:hypothetical protein